MAVTNKINNSNNNNNNNNNSNIATSPSSPSSTFSASSPPPLMRANSSAESIFERHVQYGYSPNSCNCSQPLKNFPPHQERKLSNFNFIPPGLDITTTGSSFNLNDDSNNSNPSSNNSFDNFFQDHVEDDHVIVYRRNSSLALNSLNAALGRK